MSSVLRSAAVFSFVTFVALLSAPGCSQQGEGERCDSAKNGDADCDDGLSCVKASQLRDKQTDRCCPAENTESDSRCTRSGIEPDQTPDPAGGAAGAAGAESSGGTSAGESSGGVPSSSGSGNVSQGGMSGGTPSVDGGAPAAGASVGGAGSPSAGQGGAD